MRENRFSKNVLVMWALINIMMMPVAFSSGEDTTQTKTFFQDNIYDTFGFMKVTPIVMQKHLETAISEKDQNDPVPEIKGNQGKGKDIGYNLILLVALASSIMLLVSSRNGSYGKRGQLAIFMLIFVIGIVSFGFLFYLKNLNQGSKMENQADLVINDFMTNTNFKKYMQGCLDKTSEDAIELLGIQGGHLYSDFPNEEYQLNYRSETGYYNNRPQILDPKICEDLISDQSINGIIRAPAYQPYNPMLSNTCYNRLGRTQTLCKQGGLSNSYYCPKLGDYFVPYNYSRVLPNELAFLPYSVKRNAMASIVQNFKTYPYDGSLRGPVSTELANKVGQISIGLPNLCANDLSDTQMKNAANRDIFKSCPSYPDYYTTNYSIRQKLTDFITEQTSMCFNNSIHGNESFFESKGIKGVNDTDYEIDIIIGEEDVSINMNISLEVYVANNRTVTKFARFSSKKEVRLKQVYDLANAIMRRESSDIFFVLNQVNISNSLGKSCPKFKYYGANFTRDDFDFCLKDGMEIVAFKNGDHFATASRCNSTPAGYNLLNPNLPYPNFNNTRHCNSSKILIISDGHSLLNNMPFTFSIGIENRPPALSLIHWNVSGNNETFYHKYLQQIYSNSYNSRSIYFPKSRQPLNVTPDNYNDTRDHLKHIIVNLGDPIIIIPFAVDPDDPPYHTNNSIIYTYAGWKTNQSLDDLILIARGEQKPLNLTQLDGASGTMLFTDYYDDPAKPEVKLSFYGGEYTGRNVWENSSCYKEGKYYTDLNRTEYYYYNVTGFMTPSNFPNYTFISVPNPNSGVNLCVNNMSCTNFTQYKYNGNPLMQDSTTGLGFIHKDACYVPKIDEVGYHWIRVYARDRYEPDIVYDYQDILIQVRCGFGDGLICLNETTDYHFDNRHMDCGYNSTGFPVRVTTYKGCCRLVGGNPKIDECQMMAGPIPP